MPRFPISRRALLLSSAAALACGTRKARRFAGYCFVANRDDRTVAVVDLARFRLRTGIPLDAAPATLLVHPGRRKVFVLAPQAGTVYEIDALTLALSRRIRVANLLAGMALSTGRDALWVLARDPAALIEVPLDSLRPARRIRLSGRPDHFDLQEDRAAIADTASRTIALASLERAAIERTVAAADEPSIVRFQKDARQLIAASRPERSVTMLETATGKTVVRMPLAIAPRHFCFSEDGGQLYITGDGLDAVVVVYPFQTEVAETVLAGHAPGAMAFINTDPSYLMVANPESNGLTILSFDEMGRKLVATVEVGQAPRYITSTPDHEYVLVLDEQSGDMAVIWLNSLKHRAYAPSPLFTMVPVGRGPVSAAVLALHPV